jgi:hypothetical protein
LKHNRNGIVMAATATFTLVERARPWAWLSPAVRMEIWATILGAEVAAVTIALLGYDWSILRSSLP